VEVNTPKTIDDVIERWERVDKVLKDLPPHEKRKHFQMDTWGTKTHCGTVACAAGHAGMTPWFRRRGLKLTFFKDEYGEWEVDENFGSDVQDFFVPYGETSSWALRELAKWGVTNIFYDGSDRSVATVRKEIKEFIARLQSFKVRENELLQFRKIRENG
jgi:hypothetical protein